MARKSSKTAHVMNLLAGDDTESIMPEGTMDELAAEQESGTPETVKEVTISAQQASIQTQDGPLSPNPISIIDMSSSATDPVAELIRQQLEEEENGAVENDLPEEDQILQDPLMPDSTVQDNPVQNSPVQDNPVQDNPVQDTLVQDNPVPIDLESNNQEPLPAGVAEETSSPAPVEATVSEAPVRSSINYINVMEHVVKNKVDEYMQKLDVCTCDRCIADVMALTLSMLPPKYIVMEQDVVSPLLNYYSNRFSQQVTVDLIKACSIIKENPHH